ncbi:elongator complex protein 5 [Agrilus planipennis]|uniref:Elongator complex protein 5 n=1 Tax=Agrilus planipennis TaxID=224129 RepID=A0A1W4WI10_AGRPL|nr:elongator complex protein 5 [Agrilus planipennis]
MLKTILHSNPPSKFILIEDSLKEGGTDVLNYLIHLHTEQHTEVHHFIFSGNFEKQKHSNPRVKTYDFTSDFQGWFSQQNPNINDIVEGISTKTVVVIDSLAHMIFQYGVSQCYKLIRYLKERPNIIQVATILHTDLVESVDILPFFEHLSTFCMIREPQFNKTKKRVSCIYKKPSGKITRLKDEYYFNEGQLFSATIKTVNPDVLVQQSINQMLSDTLTTFRLSLDDKERESRDKVVLPFLPKEVTPDKEESGGKITYKFDEVDDWDEEDPDDDLNI